MQSLTRYVFRQILYATLFITLTLTGVAWLTKSVQFVDKIIGGLSVANFLYLTVLALPSVLGYTLLFGLFFGTLFAYHRLYTDSEIMVMWAAGMSKLRIGRAAFVTTGIVVLCLYGITLYLLPVGIRQLKDINIEWRESVASVLIQEGVFNTIAGDLTVYVRARQSNGELNGILVHDGRDPSAPVTYMAERGALVHTDSGPKFLMFDGNIQKVERADDHLSLLYFDRYAFDIAPHTSGSGSRWPEPGERFLPDLFVPGDGQLDQRNYNELVAEGHKRLVLPLYALPLTLIALAGILSGEFSRRQRIKRLLATTAIGIALMLSGLGIQQAVAKNLWLWPLLYANVAATAACAWYVLVSRKPFDFVIRRLHFQGAD